MSDMKSKLCIVIILVSCFSINNILAEGLFTDTRYQEFIGARPMSMGETFVAVADDINAIYWNPAGIPTLDHLGINSMHSNLFSSDIGNNYLALCIPGFEKTSFGVDWMNIDFGDEEFEYGKNKFNFSFGYQPYDRLSVGVNVKYVTMNMGIKEVFHDNFSGWGGDVGLLYRLYPKLKLGLMIYDIMNTSLSRIKGPIYKRNLRLGAAYQLFNNLLMATDLDDRLHLAAEWWPFKRLLALRGGIQQDFFTEERMICSFGLGLDIPFRGQRLRFDYAFSDTPTLLNTHRYSLSFLIDLFPRLIKIKAVKIDPVYAALFKHHSRTPIGYMDIEYDGKRDLNCTISVGVNQYAEESRKAIFLPAKSDNENIHNVSLNAAFNDLILSEPDNIPLVADIRISYMSGNRPKEENVNEMFHLYHRNTIDWENGTDQAAAFVTYQDPLISQFVQNALSDEKILKEQHFITEKFTEAIHLFNAVAKYGIDYQPEPPPPGGVTKRGLDKIYYPAQAIKIKKGDCDDLSVLFASLFENRDIPTAFVDVESHIFIMFNTGLHYTLASQLPCPEELFYKYDKEIWIPLEITWIDSSFAKAWQQGSYEIQQIKDEKQSRIIEVRKAWEKYEPVTNASRFLANSQQILNDESVAEQEDVTQISKNYIKMLEQKIEQHPDSLHLRNKLGIIYARQNEIRKAENHFQKILDKEPKNFAALNNLGNLFFLKGNIDLAQQYYLKAIAYAKNVNQEDGINLNLGLIYEAADMESLAVEQFAKVMKDSTDYQKIGDLLGISFKEEELTKGDKSKAKKKISKKKVKQITKKASNKKRKLPVRKTRKQAIRKGVLPRDEIENVFYWAE